VGPGPSRGTDGENNVWTKALRTLPHIGSVAAVPILQALALSQLPPQGCSPYLAHHPA
jgi:hypothetical protein